MQDSANNRLRGELRTVSERIPTPNPAGTEKLTFNGHLDLFYNLKHDTPSFLGGSGA